jgi:hypothetical protein
MFIYEVFGNISFQSGEDAPVQNLGVWRGRESQKQPRAEIYDEPF